MEFGKQTRERLGIAGWGRDILEAGDSFELRESGPAYASDLAGKSAGVGIENTYFWNSYSEKSVS
jgi:hypothetical protein